MSTIVVDSQSVHIPAWVNDQTSFRQWVHSDEFPESGRVCFLAGEVWLDISKEPFSHNQIKGEFSRVLGGLARKVCRGRYFPDGMFPAPSRKSWSGSFPRRHFRTSTAISRRDREAIPNLAARRPAP